MNRVNYFLTIKNINSIMSLLLKNRQTKFIDFQIIKMHFIKHFSENNYLHFLNCPR